MAATGLRNWWAAFEIRRSRATWASVNCEKRAFNRLTIPRASIGTCLSMGRISDGLRLWMAASSWPNGRNPKRTPKMTTLAAVNTSNAVINAACSARLRANLNLGSRSCQTVTTDTPEIPPITTGSARLTARTSRPRCRALNKNGILRSRLAVLSRTGGEE